MRKFRQRNQPASTPNAKPSNHPPSWLSISPIVKVLVGSGLLLFLCNLGYDAAKATILRRLQLEAENKVLRAQLERIDHKVIPKIEQAHHDVKDIQQPLQQGTLTRAQLEQLALKARGVCETLEEIELMLKLNTIAQADPQDEIELADILIGVPQAQAGPSSPNKNPQRDASNSKLVLLQQSRDTTKTKRNEYESRHRAVQDSSLYGLTAGRPGNTASLNRESPTILDDDPLTGPHPNIIERNLSFLGLPVLPTSRTSADIRRVILQHKASLQDCYTRILKTQPAISGEMRLRLTIAPSGKVTAATVLTSTVNHSELEQLVVERISRWNDFGEVSAAVGNIIIKQTVFFGEDRLASPD